ncbi:MAG: rhomboid family intramembrane serine protease [Halanaerobium sp.]|nr:rhomboid family intramembrane serine protease [Halanaerobium sp.]
MKWIGRLERRFGKYAIPNLMSYIVGLNFVVYLLTYFEPTGRVLSYLVLRPSLVLKGEIWRLFTYIFIPPRTSPIFIIFVLYFYYLIGSSLENQWGTFRFNLYYLLGYLGTTIGAFISGGSTTPIYLNLSLFLAFARLYPDFQILLFFIIPLKVKYLAYINAFFIVWAIIGEPLPIKIAALVAIANYLIFFGRDIVEDLTRRKKVSENRRRFERGIKKEGEPIHRCTVCGITEQDAPEMEFRYCTGCDGYHEYCMEHLHNHEHIKDDS